MVSLLVFSVKFSALSVATFLPDFRLKPTALAACDRSLLTCVRAEMGQGQATVVVRAELQAFPDCLFRAVKKMVSGI